MVSSRFCRRSRTFCTVLFLWDSGSGRQNGTRWVSEEDSPPGAWGRGGGDGPSPQGQTPVPLEAPARALDCLVSTLGGAAGPGAAACAHLPGPQ